MIFATPDKSPKMFLYIFNNKEVKYMCLLSKTENI